MIKGDLFEWIRRKNRLVYDKCLREIGESKVLNKNEKEILLQIGEMLNIELFTKINYGNKILVGTLWVLDIKKVSFWWQIQLAGQENLEIDLQTQNGGIASVNEYIYNRVSLRMNFRKDIYYKNSTKSMEEIIRKHCGYNRIKNLIATGNVANFDAHK